MKEVTIDIQAAAFPDQFVSDATKDTVEYGLQIGQAIQYEWFRRDSGSCRFYSQWSEFMRLRLYARGEQSVAKYKNELAIDGDLSYLNLDWSPVPIIPKFVDIVVNGMSDRLFKVKAYAEDALSAEKRNEFQEMVEGEVLAKKNTRDHNWSFLISQSAISAKHRFNLKERNETEKAQDLENYLSEFESDEFQNAMSLLYLNMAEVISDGEGVHNEIISLIDMLEQEIKSHD